jgi:hypothetical protein
VSRLDHSCQRTDFEPWFDVHPFLPDGERILVVGRHQRSPDRRAGRSRPRLDRRLPPVPGPPSRGRYHHPSAQDRQVGRRLRSPGLRSAAPPVCSHPPGHLCCLGPGSVLLRSGAGKVAFGVECRQNTRPGRRPGLQGQAAPAVAPNCALAADAGRALPGWAAIAEEAEHRASVRKSVGRSAQPASRGA